MLERRGDLPVGLGDNITAVISAIQINILNAIYDIVAVKLTDWENHAKETDYTNNLIAKTFVFQTVNSYFNLFYIAYIKQNSELFGLSLPCQQNAEVATNAAQRCTVD